MKHRKRITQRRKSAGLEASADAGSGPASPGPRKLYRPVKQQVSLRLDADVLAWLKRGGRGYQTRINQALRKVMREERKGPGE